MKRFLFPMVVFQTFAALVSCGGAGGDATVSVADSASLVTSSVDTVVYGLAGAEGNDSVLDFIVPGSDPQHFNIREARSRGNIIGNFNVGDQVALVLSNNGRKVLKAVDISSIVGRWIKNGIENDSITEGLNLNSDGSAGTISTTMPDMYYTHWKISNANLVLEKQDLYGKETRVSYDTFEIVRLQEDTLVIRNFREAVPVKYVYREYNDGK